MSLRKHLLPITVLAALVCAVPAVASASGFSRSSTVLDILQRTDGAQAVVAAVLVVDEAQVLLLPPGVGPAEVGAILLEHAALPRRANLFTASDSALLRRGSITVADDSVLPVGIGTAGVQVNYEATIIRANASARNGVVHFIDTVILDGLL